MYVFAMYVCMSIQWKALIEKRREEEDRARERRIKEEETRLMQEDIMKYREVHRTVLYTY